MKLDQLIKQPQNYVIYCDLDEVLVDFTGGVEKIFGVHPDDMTKDDLWDRIYQTPNFFLDLDWSPNGKRLWQHISRYRPIILTGLPKDKHKEGLSGADQKRLWVKQHIGYNKCIVVPAKHKSQYANEHSILIDDKISNINEWKARGGIGIHHINLQSTIRQLRDLGL